MACALLLLAACSKQLQLGEQCPAPGTPGSSVAPDSGTGNIVFGTRCAPCDEPVRYDKHGCPKYVTWASCGGDICIGSSLVPAPSSMIDAGMIGDEDGGEADSAVPAGDELDASTPLDASAQEDADAQ